MGRGKVEPYGGTNTNLTHGRKLLICVPFHVSAVGFDSRKSVQFGATTRVGVIFFLT